MVADVSSTTKPPNSNPSPPVTISTTPKRVPLLPSGTDNNARPPQRRPKPKHVTSRYLSYTDTKFSTPNMQHPRAAEMSASARMLTKTSVRSLSVSFQGESFALPVSKAEKPENNGLRNDSPETKSCRIDKQKWHERSGKNGFMTMSVDFTNEIVKLNRSEIKDNKMENAFDSENSDHVVSDTDSSSVSSETTVSNVRKAGSPRAIVVPARFWHETINLLRRVQPQPQPVAVVPSLMKKNKPMHGNKGLREGAKVPSRGSSGSVLSNKPSIMSLCADSKRGKVGEKRIEDAHLLRLMHNKHMQWRFANAKADAAMVVQRAAAKKSLYNAYVTISKLWHSIVSKRLQMQQLQQNLKLHCLLKKQMLYLDNWELTDRDYSISLAGVIVALESSSLCLPVSSGAKADIQSLKDAICSAVDVMQAMAVSLYSLVTKVENVNSVASELVNAMKIESCLLDQCKDLLANLTLLENHDCSLRSHTLQLIPPTTTSQRRRMIRF